MTTIEPLDWEARLRASVAKTLDERRRQRNEREMFAERRKHGLAARHAAKLARLKTQPDTDDTPTEEP